MQGQAGYATAMGRSRVVVVALVLAALSVAALVGGIVLDRRRRLKRIGAGVAQASKPLITRCRWQRPAIGGPGQDCNAEDRLHAAVRSLFSGGTGPLGPEVLSAVIHDKPAPGEVEQYARDHATALQAVRDSVRCGWACERGAALGDYHHGTSLHALALLLVSARSSSPAECLATGLDIVRIVQDSTTGIGGLKPDLYAPILEEARRTLLRCARRADSAALRVAARDAATLARTPPPVGDTLASQASMAATRLLLTVDNPKRVGAENILWLQRGYLLDAAAALAARLDTLRGYRSADFPALFGRLDRDLPPPVHVPFGTHKRDDWAPSANQLVGAAGPTLHEVLRQAAGNERAVRLLAVALAAFRDHSAQGAWPAKGPRELAMSAFRDPLGGAAFSWSVAGDRATLAAPAAHGAPRVEVVLEP